jgi:predicted DNA-binding transcriptional regulator YafY
MAAEPTKHDTLLRQWQMLRLIPRYPAKITAGDICDRLAADGFGVTKRTVERDLASLSEVFPLLSDEREKPFGWSWKKEAVPLDVPSLGNGEALAFKLVEQYLAGLLPHATLAQLAPYFRMAGQRLNTLPKGSSYQAWTNKIRVVQPTQPLLPPRIDAKVQQMVSDALLFDRQMVIRYQKRGEDKLREYIAHPLALVQRGAITYLVATLFDYADALLLAMHRITSADILDERVRRPKDFDIDRYIAKGALGFGDGKSVKLEAIFYEPAAEHLYETPLSGDQDITPVDDTHVRVTATVANTPQLEWWLMGFGDAVEVVKPVLLREGVREMVQNMAVQYHVF